MNSTLRSYLETAIHLSVASRIIPRDDYHLDDCPAEMKAEAQADLDEFFEQAGDLLDGLDSEQVAHDFWLTRNGHGAGFWDGDYADDVGAKLTELANEFGEIDVYKGDDGQLYFA